MCFTTQSTRSHCHRISTLSTWIAFSHRRPDSRFQPQPSLALQWKIRQCSLSPLTTTSCDRRLYLSRQPSSVEGPVTAPQYCDSRLNHLDIGYWTRISITNEFAASVLSYYFESDHPIYACVDVDLFINDLVELRLRHCSAFLVSALMAFACVSLATSVKNFPTLEIAIIYPVRSEIFRS